MGWVPWRVAWDEALYAAERGFYVTRGGPAAHFTTATHGPSGAVLADSFIRFWRRHFPATLPSVVVDLGAGRGELATHFLDTLETFTGPRAGKGGTQVMAVDVVDRPAGLDDRITWVRSPGGARLPDELADLDDTLVIAHEWLDVVPCTIAQVRDDGALVEVCVDPETGDERLGDPVSTEERAWAHRYWPTDQPGDRVEIGLARDAAWADLVSRVRSGVLIAVDYGHKRSGRPSGGTLTSYRKGQQLRPVPDGTCDVTAHVAMDSLDAAGVLPQRNVLRSFHVTGELPDLLQSVTDPAGYVRALERASAGAQLIDPKGFGAFLWAVRTVSPGDVS